jgi:hypothetical protein
MFTNDIYVVKNWCFKNYTALDIQKTNVISLTDFGFSLWLVIDVISFVCKMNSIHFNYNTGDVLNLVLNCVNYLGVELYIILRFQQHANHVSFWH